MEVGEGVEVYWGPTLGVLTEDTGYRKKSRGLPENFKHN